MTDTQLKALYHERMHWLDALKRYDIPLRDLPIDQYDEIEMASAKFRTADKAIVQELKARGGIAELKGVTLHMTVDRKSFAALDPGTGRPIGWEEVYVKGFGIGRLLFRPSPSAS